MRNWVESGREILAAKGKKLSREERALFVAQIRVAELAAKVLERTPQKSQTVKEETAPKRDLRQETLDLLAGNTFREPTPQERKILAPRGYDIFLSTEPKTLYAVVDENKDHFRIGELDYVNARPDLRDYVPPALTVALRSKELFLKDSFSKPQPVQLEMTERESQTVQGLLPDARAIMLPASTDAQLDLAYLKETGRVLFRDRFARALDQISGVFAALAGRFDPDSRFCVNDWFEGLGYDFVGALSSVVFINCK